MVSADDWIAARQSLGETQVEFAARLGVSRAYLGMLETGKRTAPRAWVLEKLRAALATRGDGAKLRQQIARRLKDLECQQQG